MNTADQMTQVAPYPHDLEAIVADLEFRPGWTFTLAHVPRGQGCTGLTLTINAQVPDAVGDVYEHISRGDLIIVRHLFPVPAAAYNYNSWLNWVLECCMLVDRHEGCEFFRINGERVFAPHHSEGEDPYIVWHIGDRATADKRSTDV